jgi:hypothetical protein
MLLSCGSRSGIPRPDARNMPDTNFNGTGGDSWNVSFKSIAQADPGRREMFERGA